MALSDIIRKIEESPRSTKIAVGTSIGAVGIAGAALAFALLNDRSELYVPPEPAPVVQYVETPTAVAPLPIPTVEPTSQPLTFEENSVVLQGSDFYVNSDKGRKMIEITDSKSFVTYLFNSGVVDQKELEKYEQEEVLQLSIEELANEMFELVQSQGYENLDDLFGFEKEDVKYLVGFAESSEAEVQSTPAEPAITPTRVSEDYYVILEKKLNNWGTIEYYADFPSFNRYAAKTGNIYQDFSNSDFFLNHLLKEGAITLEQKNAYFRDGWTKVSLDDISVAVYKLLQSKGYHGMREDFDLEEGDLQRLLYYFDESLLESSGGDNTPTSSGGYVVIRDGSLETVVTDDDGNTARVKIDTVDAEEFLDYLLSQGKITVEQHDEYGKTNSVEFSLKDVKDAADFFDWAYSSDEGLNVWIDQENLNYFREQFEPIFSFGE